MQSKVIKNKWFCGQFVPSFGICKNRQITEKQAEIFMRYLDQVSLRKTGSDYHGYTECYEIILQVSSVYNGSGYNSNGRYEKYRCVYCVTIKGNHREVVKKVKYFDKLWEDIFQRTDISDDEKDRMLDDIENQIDEIQGTIM